MILPNRLLACANYVVALHTVTDVGTDHGLLACYLAQKGHQVVAADVNEKPLAQAQNTIKKYHLQQQVRTCLSDGLAAIDPADAQDIIIAGMGGELIFSLILASAFVKSPDHRLILQPMTQADYLRTRLCQTGFALVDETALFENGHHYTVLLVQYTGTPCQLSPLQALCGVHLDKQDPSSVAYLKHQQTRLQRRLAGLSLAKHQTDESAQLEQLLATLNTYL